MNSSVFLFLLFAFVLVSCNKENTDPESTETASYDDTPYVLEIGKLPEPSIPSDNQLTKQGVMLGRMLFYEKKLSADNSQSCSSCHLQEYAFTDTARFSLGIRREKGARQAISVFNMAWHTNEFFWYGRAHLLRDQALLPIQDELEMDETLENVVAKLSEDEAYQAQFIRAFGTDEITSEKIALALEQFMNSIISINSKYDRFLEDSSIFSDAEIRGLRLFETEYNPFFPSQSGADCKHCHGGPNFENDNYMNNGLDEDINFKDYGREVVTNLSTDQAKFKVTSLRNIAVTAPYMHDGRFKTLEEVVEHYNSGIRYSSTLDLALEQTREKGLMLSGQDKADLVAFLKTLTDEKLLTNQEYSNPFED